MIFLECVICLCVICKNYGEYLVGLWKGWKGGWRRDL